MNTLRLVLGAISLLGAVAMFAAAGYAFATESARAGGRTMRLPHAIVIAALILAVAGLLGSWLWIHYLERFD